jgi:hypothetical protein
VARKEYSMAAARNLALESHGRQARNQGVRYGSRAHQIFRRAREWQFDVFVHGKHTKHKVITSHLKVLCLGLVWFDPTGSGMSIFPSLKKLLARINDIEAERASGGKARAWNMRKLYRYLRVLEDSKMMGCQGSPHNRKPRNRFLFPAMLLKCQPGRRESVTRAPANLSPVDPNLSPNNSSSYTPKQDTESRAWLRPRRVYESRFESFREGQRQKPHQEEFTPERVARMDRVKACIAESEVTGRSADWLMETIRVCNTALFIQDEQVFLAAKYGGAA